MITPTTSLKEASQLIQGEILVNKHLCSDKPEEMALCSIPLFQRGILRSK